jgi:hypothetical protein
VYLHVNRFLKPEAVTSYEKKTRKVTGDFENLIRTPVLYWQNMYSKSCQLLCQRPGQGMQFLHTFDVPLLALQNPATRPYLNQLNFVHTLRLYLCVTKFTVLLSISLVSFPAVFRLTDCTHCSRRLYTLSNSHSISAP